MNYDGIYIDTPDHNVCMDYKDDSFYISYNFGDIAIYGCETTALVKGQGQAFYILNGDHREKYGEIIHKGFSTCFKYFIENAHSINKLSEYPGENPMRIEDGPTPLGMYMIRDSVDHLVAYAGKEFISDLLNSREWEVGSTVHRSGTDYYVERSKQNERV